MLIDFLNSDNRVEIFESFDDPEQPYSCFEWGEIGQDGIPLIIETEHQFHEWFSISGSFGVDIQSYYNGSTVNQFRIRALTSAPNNAYLSFRMENGFEDFVKDIVEDEFSLSYLTNAGV